ncbi:YgiQ family radical SAM protein [Phosphitispora fastidiosa]|uniref:YgiQ family radical SAM protein n=1 Tax=Phosphitispora fastidiosa TaxID=2837202 RepID=UPI001E4AECED|nr:YgiQ family radical SAM protein [Phosphitispora fastidiosa]MBU7005266.1 putative radical SAM protein YgiQ [Phosphitispora fastidiosa]
MSYTDFLPMTREEMDKYHWHYVDFLVVTGDAYVDHPSFGTAIIARLLSKLGFKVGIIAQPDWHDTGDFTRLGKPRYACLVTAGNLDSMVSNYTGNRNHRKKDLYSPGGVPGKRPDRAAIVYSNRIREAWPGIPLVIGGIEASLRRLAHYDYWDNKVRRSILLDSRADILVYGMGEKQVEEIALRLANGEAIGQLTDIPGTAYVVGEKPPAGAICLPGFDEVSAAKSKYAEAFRLAYGEQDPFRGRTLVQPHGLQYVVQNAPAQPLTTEEMDAVYEMPFMRSYHPAYAKYDGIPALKEVKFSITAQRGCFGGCAFCALNFHQGCIIQPRSHDSILREARLLTELPDFKGIIHDVGGPTANFRKPACRAQLKRGTCADKHCLAPDKCKNVNVDHADLIELLRKIRSLPGVKKVFLRSGLRYDYLLYEKDPEVLREICKYHVSGQLKVAPEHVSSGVLKVMRKPGHDIYRRFTDKFYEANRLLGKKQYLVPYFIASHPGSTLKDAIELAEYIRDMGYNPEQVQDFTPTPGSLSTCIYYTGIDPLTGQKVYVPRSSKERQMQRALIQYRNPKNRGLVKEALRKAGREDLIGKGPKCLVR